MRYVSQLIVFLMPILAAAQPGLFESSEILNLTIGGDVRTLLNDRGEDPQYHPVYLSYDSEIGNQERLEIRARSRGNFRRQRSNCTYPPLLLNFGDEGSTSNTLFDGPVKLKLVTPCKSDKYVVREYLVYKLYNQLTDASFKVRLVQLVFEDTKRGRTTDPMYAFLIEDEDHLAERHGMEVVEELGIRPEKLDFQSFQRMALFQYFIGNTDWSVQYQHNMKLLSVDGTQPPITVPYDFDLTGLVSAPYAKPSTALKLSSVQERRYRGYCLQAFSLLQPFLTEYDEKKEDLLYIVESETHIDHRYREWALRYFGKFYELLSDQEKIWRELRYPCDPNGTGNVVIRGLKN